jgi:hypothetical protein
MAFMFTEQDLASRRVRKHLRLTCGRFGVRTTSGPRSLPAGELRQFLRLPHGRVLS